MQVLIEEKTSGRECHSSKSAYDNVYIEGIISEFYL